MKWYEEIEIDGEILQGDIVMSCPVLITNVVDKTKGLNELIESEEGLLETEIQFSYVIFSEVYQVNTHLLLEAIRKQEKRVIMNSPYREWLSQRFGNYYARVGLPYAIGKKELYEACYKEASR